MADIFSKEKRHEIMSHIKSDDTKPELKVRKYLFAQGFRYRKNDRRYPGRPDIVLPKYRTVVFVNGCFWHGHEGCKLYSTPKSNSEFWKAKIERNQTRDIGNRAELEKLGWRVLTVWECEVSTKEKFEERMETLVELIRHNNDPNSI